jgi:hypothetical protein
MCLACELDAMWFAEMAARAESPAPGGDTSTRADAGPAADGVLEASQLGDGAPAAAQPANAQGVRQATKSGFICEETPAE